MLCHGKFSSHISTGSVHICSPSAMSSYQDGLDFVDGESNVKIANLANLSGARLIALVIAKSGPRNVRVKKGKIMNVIILLSFLSRRTPSFLN